MLDGRVDGFARHSIHGWAADASRPDAAVEVTISVDGHERGRARADHPRPDLQALGTLGDGAHGFVYALDPALSPLRSYELAVYHAATGEPLRLGCRTIAPELSPTAERVRPILVTASGQPGGTELMRSLAGDPGIVAADGRAYGVRLMEYYARALEVLVVPGGGAPAENGRGGNDAAYVLAPNPFHAPELEHLFGKPRLLYEFFQHQSEAPICGAFKAVVAQFYETLAMHQGKRLPGYFAEQCDLFDIAPTFARMAFRVMREIVLLADPRDAYCGYRTLWFTSPAQAMAALRRMRDRTVALRRENRHDTMFVRCEDLRLRPDAALREISRFLSLDHAVAADPETLRAASATADDLTMPGVGQWKNELDGDEIALFEREFGEYLELFGYETT